MGALLRAVLTVRGAALALWVLAAAPSFASAVMPTEHSPYGSLLEGADGFFAAAVSAGLWTVFGAVLAALLLPGALALTVVRVAAPANALGLLGAAAFADELSWAGAGPALLGGTAAGVAVLLPAYGGAAVDAGGYGDERRFLLRPPGLVLAALIPLTWAAAVVGAAAGPLLLADRRWTAGAVATSVGFPAAAAAGHALFRLARRWLVFVPAGVVVHDHMTVAQPIPLARRGIASLGPAPSDGDAVDLTAQAFGLALELRFKAPVRVPVVTGRGRSEQRSAASVLISPSRPAAVMATAAKRGIAIG